MDEPKRAAALFLAVLLITTLIFTFFCYPICELIRTRQRLEEVTQELTELRGTLKQAIEKPMNDNKQKDEGEGAKKVTETPASYADHTPPPEPFCAASDKELTIRGFYNRDIVAPHLEMIDKVTRYARHFGYEVADGEIRDFCDMARNGGYDPRLWVVIAMAESGGRNNGNIYGFCGKPGSPWQNVGGTWRQQTEWLHDRITTFYSQHVDISDPAQVLWFHHEGEPLNGRNPRSVFYVRNVMGWIEGM